MSGVWVVAEHRQGEMREITFEMLGKGIELAQFLDTQCYALVLGDGVSSLVTQIKPFIPKILSLDTPVLSEYNALIYRAVLSELLRKYMPTVVMIGHTACGMEYAPRLCAEMKWPLVTDCVDIQVMDGSIEVIRRMYSDKVNARVGFRGTSNCIITVRGGAFPSDGPAEYDAQVTMMPSPLISEFPARRFVELVAAPKGEVDITRADILISVGRGLGGPENFPPVEALAEALGATISCSRPVVDKKWLPKERQVGTSGKKVAPKVYLALGISGAFQHVTAMKHSGTIIAVNKDPRAPIFNVADYGIVGDMFEVIPALLKLLKE
jgi:electron transfer flavoprotein alpha subunit